MAEISGRPITASQVRTIHVALARLGIDDAEYRERLRAGWGVASCKELTRRQASELLHSLDVPLRQAPGTRPARERAAPLPDNVVQLRSAAQQRLIRELVDEIFWRDGDGFTRWLDRNLGLRTVATGAEAQKVIEGLKGIVRRQRAILDDDA